MINAVQFIHIILLYFPHGLAGVQRRRAPLMWCRNLYTRAHARTSWWRRSERIVHMQLLDRCGLRAPLIAQVERQTGWARLWDAALDYGVSHTRELQLLSRVFSHHGKGNHPCPLCDIAPLEDSVMGHLVANHCGELGLVQETDLELILC